MVAPGKVFTFQELASATENFNPDLLVGEGAFGRVYKGRLKSTNQVRRPALFLFSQNLALSTASSAGGGCEAAGSKQGPRKHRISCRGLGIEPHSALQPRQSHWILRGWPPEDIGLRVYAEWILRRSPSW